MEYIRICLQNRTTLSATEEAYSLFKDRMLATVHGFQDTSVISSNFSSDEETALNNITIAVAHKMYLERYFAQYKQA